jgi:hypothetical protein
MFKRQDEENQWDRHQIGRRPDIPPIIPHLTPIERVCIPRERTVLDYDFLKLLAFQWVDRRFVFNAGHTPELYLHGLCREEDLWLVGGEVYTIVDLQELIPRAVFAGDGYAGFHSQLLLRQLDKQIRQTNVPQWLLALEILQTMTDAESHAVITDILFQMRQNAACLDAAELYQSLVPEIVNHPLHQILIEMAERNLLAGIDNDEFARRLYRFNSEQLQYAAWCAGRYPENPYPR